MGASELPAVLGRNHAATVVYATLYQRIAGVKIVLGLHVDDEGNLFLGVGNDGAEANVIGDCPEGTALPLMRSASAGPPIVPGWYE